MNFNYPKRILSIFLVLYMLVPAFALQGFAANDEVANNNSDLQTIINSATDDTVITLDSSFITDFTAPIILTNTSGYNITIDGEGKALHMLANARHFNVTSTSGTITLCNFILDGNATTLSSNAGGVSMGNNTSITFQNCVFIDNAAGYGAAIVTNSNCTVDVIACSFVDNIGNGSGYNGGAIAIDQHENCHLTVTDSYFLGNKFNTKGTGGAISLYHSNNASLTVDNCFLKITA